MPNESPPHQEISSREWMLIASILLLGGVLRLLFVGAFHVEHFDEGVYASNRWFSAEEGARFPDRHLYGPPLWPAVLEYSQLLFGPTSLGVMLPGILCGTLAIGFLWRLLRAWVGREEALLVAGILAVSGFHILFSRTALTDVPVTMLMLCGIGLGWSSLSRSSWPMAVSAGLFTGLAWSVKYNGWFPLAVTGAGFAAANLFHVKQSGILFRQWGCWLLMAAVAGVVWLPAWRDLQSPGRGGYAAVATNHAGYLTGWENWLEQFRIQFENLSWFDDRYIILGLLGLLALFIVVDLLRIRGPSPPPDDRSPRLAGALPVVVIVALIMFSWVLGQGISLPRIWLAFALFGLGVRLTDLIRAPGRGESVTPGALAGWMALAWVSSLLLTTPMYRPYPRLALPLYFALIAGTAFGLRELKRCFRSGQQDATEGEAISGPVSRGTKVGLVSWGLASLIISHVLVQGGVSPSLAGSPWQSRLSMETASHQIVEECNTRAASRLSSSVAYVVYVYGEPALYYHLCRLAPQNVVIVPVANLGFRNDPPAREPVPIFLVSGPHSARDPKYLQEREQAGERLISIAQIEVQTSDLLLLDIHSPGEIVQLQNDFSAATIELSEMQPVSPARQP